jgi:sugar phosphate isomerase/epimerase
MKLAASNIAWPPDRRADAYAALAARDIRGLEIAPGLFFAGADDPFDPDAALARARLAEIEGAGLRLVSMQSLLFGVQGAALFEDADALARLTRGMERAIDLAGRFAIPNLVFGSPRQRVIPDAMPPHAARARAAEAFHALGDRAAAAGTVIAMEANPAAYGTNFLTHAEDVVAFVRAIDRPGLRMVLDLGAMRMNGAAERTPALIQSAADLLSHVHVSEPHLAPAPETAEGAAPVLSALARAGYPHWVSIEMKAAPADPVGAMAAAVDRLRAAERLSRTAKGAADA